MLKNNLKIKEDDLDVLQLIYEDPKISQRKIANKLGLSLGKVNYCIKSLSKVGFIKLKNFLIPITKNYTCTSLHQKQ